MAFRWRANDGPLLVTLILSTQKSVIRVVELDPLRQNFLDPRMSEHEMKHPCPTFLIFDFSYPIINARWHFFGFVSNCLFVSDVMHGQWNTNIQLLKMKPLQCKSQVYVSPRVCHRMTHISSENQDPGSVSIYQTFLKTNHLKLHSLQLLIFSIWK